MDTVQLQQQQHDHQQQQQPQQMGHRYRRAVGPAMPARKWDDPVLHRGSRNVNAIIVNESTHDEYEEDLFLVRSPESGNVDDEHANIQYGYRKIRTKFTMGHRGKVYLCHALGKVRNSYGLVFQEEEKKNFVAIKMLYLQHIVTNGNQNPYNDIRALIEFGNDVHVIKCHEALYDDNCLYIVMTYFDSGDLFDRLATLPPPGFTGIDKRRMFQQLIANVEYLQDHGISHRDLKPENVLLSSSTAEETNSSTPGTVLIDLEMSLLVPTTGTGQSLQYHKIVSTGGCGTYEYMSPEIYQNESFDGFAVDVWALGVMLFVVHALQKLYAEPSNADYSYYYFITNKGLTNDELNNRKLAQLTQGNKKIKTEHSEKIRAVQRLDPTLRDLIQKMLNPKVNERLTLDEVKLHPWLN